MLRAIIFPFGMNFSLPSDKLSQKVALLFLEPTPSRYRLSKGAFLTPREGNIMGVIEDALIKVIAAEPIEKTIKTAVSNGQIKGDNMLLQAKAAALKNIITSEQLEIVLKAENAGQSVIEVYDFAP